MLLNIHYTVVWNLAFLGGRRIFQWAVLLQEKASLENWSEKNLQLLKGTTDECKVRTS